MTNLHGLKPTVWVGKNGLTGEVIREVIDQLESRGLVKVRFLRAAEMDVSALERAADARVLEVRGRNVVLERKDRF